MITKENGLRYAKLIHVSVDNGKTENSNKVYIMEELSDGRIKCEYGRVGKALTTEYKPSNKWADIDKTVIILNGGTTNNNPERLGTLNKHLNNLNDNGIVVQSFHEPDLNNALTAICFLVDERVWNRELYLDFKPETLPWSNKKPSEKALSHLEEKNKKNYAHWEEKIGNKRNVFLRDFLPKFRLA